MKLRRDTALLAAVAATVSVLSPPTAEAAAKQSRVPRFLIENHAYLARPSKHVNYADNARVDTFPYQLTIQGATPA